LRSSFLAAGSLLLVVSTIPHPLAGFCPVS
jgi:hypothetical protein